MLKNVREKTKLIITNKNSLLIHIKKYNIMSHYILTRSKKIRSLRELWKCQYQQLSLNNSNELKL